jgi:hypothetical protein
MLHEHRGGRLWVRLRTVRRGSRTATAFELVRVSHGQDLQLLPGEPGNIVRVVRHANVINQLLGCSAVGVLEDPQRRPPGIGPPVTSPGFAEALRAFCDVVAAQ